MEATHHVLSPVRGALWSGTNATLACLYANQYKTSLPSLPLRSPSVVATFYSQSTVEMLSRGTWLLLQAHRQIILSMQQ